MIVDCVMPSPACSSMNMTPDPAEAAILQLQPDYAWIEQPVRDHHFNQDWAKGSTSLASLAHNCKSSCWYALIKNIYSYLFSELAERDWSKGLQTSQMVCRLVVSLTGLRARTSPSMHRRHSIILWHIGMLLSDKQIKALRWLFLSGVDPQISGVFDDGSLQCLMFSLISWPLDTKRHRGG